MSKEKELLQRALRIFSDASIQPEPLKKWLHDVVDCLSESEGDQHTAIVGEISQEPQAILINPKQNQIGFALKQSPQVSISEKRFYLIFWTEDEADYYLREYSPNYEKAGLVKLSPVDISMLATSCRTPEFFYSENPDFVK